ncbi:MAG: hypothetical protein LBU39_11885 [Desulfobulbaceae bacterium]|jgi:hypothetical protein|nr:hypothetical protein [Desulfobulbaceae bacterium]
MQAITIHCVNKGTAPFQSAPVSLGVPIPAGVSPRADRFLLKDAEGRLIPVQTQVLNRWPDTTVKWLLCDFLASVGPEARTTYSLEYAAQTIPPPSGCRIDSRQTTYRIATGAMVVEIASGSGNGMFSVYAADGGEPICHSAAFRLLDLSGHEWPMCIDQIMVEVNGPVRTTLAIGGTFVGTNKRRLLVHTRLHLYAGTAICRLEARLHNPEAARHPGNLWDLGDPASIMIKEWALAMPLAANHLSSAIYPTASEPARQLFQRTGAIYQESSGGRHWDSPVHRNRDGLVPMRLAGWMLTTGEVKETGERAQPILQAIVGENQVSVGLEHFWQRFPKSLASEESVLRVGLLPGNFPGGHELQGGEQMTERLRFDFSKEKMPGFVAAPALFAFCDKRHCRDALVFPEGLWEPVDPGYRQLLAIAQGPKGFLAKREQADEYSWRNFGELYADHEAAQHQEKTIFVSHYNNQYDPLYSFFRLALAAGDCDWFELGLDLSDHIADIDINHTDLDREEYCNGLFWHTDHYLDAGLSTHRMAGKEHLLKKNPALCGGGPDSQHCYSAGLTLHHFLTGDPRSRQLVLQLADWCWLSLRGPQTLGAATLRAVQNGKRFLRDRGALWPRFPLNRGTGNCLNAAIDAFELTGDGKYLIRAAELIQGTVHPTDNIAERDLLDAERHWSYTVFLAAVGRYLAIKRLWNQFDQDFSHARQSLLAYGRWMIEHEYPYLEKPEILEYPNETWAGQDLRKGAILYFAALQTAGEERERFLVTANFFLDYGIAELRRQTTNYYTRPLVLMMQNAWVGEALSEAATPGSATDVPEPNGQPTPRLNPSSFMQRTVADLAGILPRISLKREWRWLKTRFASR